MPSLVQLFTVLGVGVALKLAHNLFSVLYFYFLSPPQYHRYLYGKAPYALVTGATDGIGKAVAAELYAKGFNLILHGRNIDKLRIVQREIKQDSSREIRLWVADASSPDVDFASALKQWEDIEITVVFNNVGGGDMKDARIDQIPEQTLISELHLNATFPWLLSRALLPKLRRASGPTILVYIGSVAAFLPLPGYNPYGASKAFVRQLSATLGADERFFTTPSNISTLYLAVGSVVTNSRRTPVSLLSPTAKDFAKHVVHKIGSARRETFAYWAHALQMWSMVTFLPDSVLCRSILTAMEDELEQLKIKKA